MFDISANLNAVVREIREVEHDGKPARAVVATRAYKTDREDLWDALTSPERIPRWFLPVEGELKPGGRFQFKGNAGGDILRCERPELVAVTWEMRGDVSWVTLRLQEVAAEETRLELEHVAHVDEAMWEQFGPGAVGIGWELGLSGLDEHLQSGEAVDPAAAEAWSGSEEGKEFMTRSSEAWADAVVAAGGDESSAREAAARVTAFYTGG